MTAKEEAELSKFLSLILRHKPEVIDLQLDPEGWANVDELIEKANRAGKDLSFEIIEQIVIQSDKKRFSFNNDLTKIRANQGHSISVDLGLISKVPPSTLYHGTAIKNLPSIKHLGLLKGLRNHVHLSLDKETALKVGSRYGQPVILKVRSNEMVREGFIFFESENGVWLTDHVPSEFIDFSL